MLTTNDIKKYKEIEEELTKLIHMYFDEFIKCDNSYQIEDWCIRNAECFEIEIHYSCTDYKNNFFYEDTIVTLDELNSMID